MTVVASQDIGTAGPATGEPVPLHWPVYRHLSRFVVWPVLLLLLLRPANRKPGVWKILVPAAIIQLLVLGIEIVAPAFSMGGFMVFADEFYFVAFSLAFLWLFAGIARHVDTPILSLLLVIVVIGVGWVQILFRMGLDDISTVGYFVFYTLLSGAIVLALIVSGLLCRKRYSPGRYLRIACICLMCFSLLPLPLIGFVALVQMAGSGDIALVLTVLGGGTLFLLGVGASLCILVGVHFGIALRNPELRSRFERVVRPRPESKPPLSNGFTGIEPVGKEVL